MSDRSNNVIVTCIPGGVSKVEAGRTLDGLVETGLLLCWQSPLEGGHGHTLRRSAQGFTESYQKHVRKVFQCRRMCQLLAVSDDQAYKVGAEKR